MKSNPSTDEEIKSTKNTIETVVQTPVKLHEQQNIRDFKGKLEWDGDLELMRTD